MPSGAPVHPAANLAPVVTIHDEVARDTAAPRGRYIVPSSPTTWPTRSSGSFTSTPS